MIAGKWTAPAYSSISPQPETNAILMPVAITNRRAIVSVRSRPSSVKCPLRLRIRALVWMDTLMVSMEVRSEHDRARTATTLFAGVQAPGGRGGIVGQGVGIGSGEAPRSEREPAVQLAATLPERHAEGCG